MLLGSLREICQPGARPNRIPAEGRTKQVNTSTARSICADEILGMSMGAQAIKTCMRKEGTQHSTNVPPMSARSRLSVSNCQMILPRVAPSEERIAISDCRGAARERSRVPMFAHAINSTRAARSHQDEERGPKVSLPCPRAKAPVSLQGLDWKRDTLVPGCSQ